MARPENINFYVICYTKARLLIRPECRPHPEGENVKENPQGIVQGKVHKLAVSEKWAGLA